MWHEEICVKHFCSHFLATFTLSQAAFSSLFAHIPNNLHYEVLLAALCSPAKNILFASHVTMSIVSGLFCRVHCMWWKCLNSRTTQSRELSQTTLWIQQHCRNRLFNLLIWPDGYANPHDITIWSLSRAKATNFSASAGSVGKWDTRFIWQCWLDMRAQLCGNSISELSSLMMSGIPKHNSISTKGFVKLRFVDKLCQHRRYWNVREPLTEPCAVLISLVWLSMWQCVVSLYPAEDNPQTFADETILHVGRRG